MNRVKEVQRINAKDLATQLASSTKGDAGSWDVNKSWHAEYRDSAYVYVGGLPYDLSEGDVSTIMAQWGEIVDVNMPRDKGTGKPKGFAFICYEDQRSTVLAVDNFNGAKLLGRTVRCDHCRDYREEQAKDPDAIPDHVAKRLSDKELDTKRREILDRNAEIGRVAEEKEGRFATARGTAATPAEREESEVRAQMFDDKERDATARRTSHIEAVLSRRKREHDSAHADEKRKAAAKEEWKRQRVIEEQSGARKADVDKRSGREDAIRAPPPPPQGAPGAPAGGEDEERMRAAASKFERLMGGERDKKKKKKKERHEREPGAGLFKQAPAAVGGGERAREGAGEKYPSEKKKMGEDAVSVQETNAMREKLGLKPLR